jgi:glycosyltransferase involved in cell wall biosynthesis
MRQPLHEAGVPAERIALVENGIDTTRFIPGGPVLSRDKLGIPSDAFVFGGMMRLSPEKNPLGLLEAFSHIRSKAPQAWLVLAGDGPQRPEVEQWLRASSAADRVCLLGARNDPERIYPLFDCFVLPSLTEGLPLALLEAMACERSVVASRVGQVATVLDGLPAHLVPAADVTALEAAMLQALDTHPQPVAAMRQRVEARYSVARMAREYAQLYRELENRNGRLAA